MTDRHKSAGVGARLLAKITTIPPHAIAELRDAIGTAVIVGSSGFFEHRDPDYGFRLLIAHKIFNEDLLNAPCVLWSKDDADSRRKLDASEIQTELAEYYGSPDAAYAATRNIAAGDHLVFRTRAGGIAVYVMQDQMGNWVEYLFADDDTTRIDLRLVMVNTARPGDDGARRRGGVVRRTGGSGEGTFPQRSW